MLCHSQSFCDVIRLPASSFTYISQNSSATSIWLDHNVCSKPQLVSQIRILYGDTSHDHILTYCEISIPCINPETNLQDQQPEMYLIKWDNISDDQKHYIVRVLMPYLLKFGLMYSHASCLFCDDSSHHRQLDFIYIALIESLCVSASPVIKSSKHRCRKILWWIGTAKTCNLIAGSTFYIGVEMVVRVVIDFLRQWKLHVRLLKMFWKFAA